VCPYTDGDFQTYKQTMRDIPRTGKVKNAIYTLLDHCVVHGKSGEGKYYGTYDRLTYGEMYKIVVRTLGLSVDIVSDNNHWSSPYLSVVQQQ